MRQCKLLGDIQSKRYRNMRTITTEQLYKLLDRKKAFVFGTGFVSCMFCSALGSKRSNIAGCLVSKRDSEKEKKFSEMFPEIVISTPEEAALGDSIDNASEQTVESGISTSGELVPGDKYRCLSGKTAGTELSALGTLADIKKTGTVISTSNEITEKDEMTNICDIPVLVAVHETFINEVESFLSNYGFNDLIWIYPNLHEMVFGEAIENNVLIPVSEIINKQSENEFWIELRYSAFRDYIEGNKVQRFIKKNKELCCIAGREEPFSLYRKGMMLFSNPDTVEERLKKIPELAASFMEHGYIGEYPILIDENMRLIDGGHRLAAAAYFGIKKIPCRIVKAHKEYEKVITENVRLTSDIILSYMKSDELHEDGNEPKKQDDHLRQNNPVTDHLKKHGADKTIFAMSDLTELKIIKEKMKHNPNVTLVIPVYNVDGYLDQCMESIASQTYTDYEVILINDGSKDGSGLICRSWAKKDARIRFIDQENKGVSACRNLGVKLAGGEYIGFIDPDDWIEPDYIQELYTMATENDADYVECDIFRYYENTGKEVYRSVYGKMGIPYTLEEHMKYAPTASYKSLFRKSLWIKNGIHMPPCAFESPAVYSLVLALANKVINIRKPLYHYRVGRKDSLIENGYALKNGAANNTLGTEAMAFLLGEYKRTGIFGKYKNVLEELVTYRLSDILATQFTRKTPGDYAETVKNFKACIAELFPEKKTFSYVNIGGYNLNRILVYLDQLQDPYCRFNFSSIISLLPVTMAGQSAIESSCINNGSLPAVKENKTREYGESKENNDRKNGKDNKNEINKEDWIDPVSDKTEKRDVSLKVHHKNRYRQIMINRDISGDFWKIVREKQPDYLFMDFIEERFDIAEYEGRYITISDAFEGAEVITSSRDHSTEEENPTKQNEGIAGKEFVDKITHVGKNFAEGATLTKESSDECQGSVIMRNSDKCKDLWQKALLYLKTELKKVSPETKIVIVENYLSEYKGTVCCRDDRFKEKNDPSGNNEDIVFSIEGQNMVIIREDFPDIAKIRHTNTLLKQYYDFAKEALPEAEFVPAFEAPLYFTDKDYEYGAVPSHLNEVVNKDIAAKIKNML